VRNKSQTSTILAVDDNPRNLQVIGSLIKKWGYNTVLAQSASECLQYLYKNSPDLILMDILMPDMDGYETCRKIKADPKNKHIPILFITALSDTNSIVMAFKAGGVDYITKPFIREEVKARIDVHLELKATLKKLERMTITDEMTGVYNRRFANVILQRELKIARRLSQTFLVCGIDIDHLKQINDNHGHESGDSLIKKVVEGIKLSIRETDYIFRMGGDEFLLVLPNTKLSDGESLLKRVHHEIHQETIFGVPIDFSYGLAVFELDNECPIDKLLRIADDRMYKQKKLKKEAGSTQEFSLSTINNGR